MPEHVAFILSTARTGTRAFAEGLAGDGVCSPHQPPWSRLLTCVSNYHLHGWAPLALVRALTHAIRLRQIRGSGARVYAEVFSLDHLPAKILHDELPQVRVLHLVRDPRTFVPSYLNWTHTRAKSYIANKLVPGWHPSGYFTGEVPWAAWRRMDEFQRVCWHWSFKNRWIEDAFGGSDRYLRVQFEDVIFSPGRDAALRRVLEFLGIPFEARHRAIYAQEKNTSRKTFFPRYADWPAERRVQLRELCGALMRHYGYDPDTEPAGPARAGAGATS